MPVHRMGQAWDKVGQVPASETLLQGGRNPERRCIIRAYEPASARNSASQADIDLARVQPAPGDHFHADAAKMRRIRTRGGQRLISKVRRRKPPEATGSVC